LVLKIIDEFAIFAIFACEDLLEFKDRGIEGHPAVTFED
jgi:hypothetical protein